MQSGDDSKKPDSVRSSESGAKGKGQDRDMGAALRGVYQRTVDEAIPVDLLDLLGKLD